MCSFSTNQENGQLELVVEHHSMNTAGSAEPRCDLVEEVGVEDKEEDTGTWDRMQKDCKSCETTLTFYKESTLKNRTLKAPKLL